MGAVQLQQLLVLAQVQLRYLGLAHIQDTQVRVLRYVHARHIRHLQRQLHQVRALRRVNLRQRAGVVCVERAQLRVLRHVEVRIQIAHHRYLQNNQRVFLTYHQRSCLRKWVIRYIQSANLGILAKVYIRQLVVVQVQNIKVCQFGKICRSQVATFRIDVCYRLWFLTINLDGGILVHCAVDERSHGGIQWSRP